MEQQINHPTAMADLPDRSSAMDDTTISHHHTGSRVAMPLKVTAPRTAGSSPSQDRFTAAPGHESVPTGDGPYLEVSLIIPARNEEHRLRSCIEAYWRTFETRYETRFEIIVVTNGCIDNTVAIANEAARTRPNLRVHDIPHAAGKGAAVLEGFRQARGDHLLFADADAATSAVSLLELVAALERCDIAIGSRRLPGSVVLQPQSILRRLCGALFLVAVRFLFGLPYRDTQCGAKALRRGPASELAACVRESRWAFDVDLLLTARALGLRIVEQPVTWANDGSSGLRILPTAFEVARSLRRIRRHHAGPDVSRGGHRQSSPVVRAAPLNDMEQR